MSRRPRVWITGPTGRGPNFARAARRAGWTARVHELLAAWPREVAAPQDAPDALVLASANALAAARDLVRTCPSRRFACVGARAARGMEALGLSPLVAPAKSAQELLGLLAPLEPRSALVLCGPLSDELARGLLRLGWRVEPRIAYQIEARPGPTHPVEADAVFFASPSALDAYGKLPAAVLPRGARAIAIGPTTRDAILGAQGLETALRGPILCLESPTPKALHTVLSHLTAKP